MNVFISWSGPRSRAIADALRVWLPRVIQAAKPRMSDEDISAGSRWLSEIQTELFKSSLGIICVTPENQASPWLLFEAGALSKALSQAHVCPLLVGLAPSQLAGPLSQFQASEANREGIGRIVSALNKAMGQDGIPANDIEEIVNVWWPRLEKQIAEAMAITHNEGKKRTLEEILEEVVSNSREQLRRENLRIENSQERDNKFDEMLNTMTSSLAVVQQLQERFKALSTEVPKPKEFAKDLGTVPALNIDQILNIFGSLRGVSERQKSSDQPTLQRPNKDESHGPSDA